MVGGFLSDDLSKMGCLNIQLIVEGGWSGQDMASQAAFYGVPICSELPGHSGLPGLTSCLSMAYQI